jgi:RND family efflux transporter MFP subunit
MKKTIFSLIAVLILSILLQGCQKKEKQQEKVFPVEVIKLQPKGISKTIALAGTVDSKVHTWVNSPVEGSILSLKVSEGDGVKAGDVLCYVMPAEYFNMFGQAQSDYEQSLNDYSNAAESEKTQLKEKLNEVKNRLEFAKKLYKAVPLVSPVKGVVVSKTIETGDNVSVKQPLIEIADLQQIIVKSAIAEDYVSKIRLNQPAKIKLHSFPDEALSGKVSVIAPAVQVESRTSYFEISLSADKRLKPGMTATVELAVEHREGVLAVPQESVMVTSDGGKYVFVVENELAKKVKITSGVESNMEAEIITGLKKGDMVVITGQESLKDGVKVKIPESKSEKNGKKK